MFLECKCCRCLCIPLQYSSHRASSLASSAVAISFQCGHESSEKPCFCGMEKPTGGMLWPTQTLLCSFMFSFVICFCCNFYCELILVCSGGCDVTHFSVWFRPVILYVDAVTTEHNHASFPSLIMLHALCSICKLMICFMLLEVCYCSEQVVLKLCHAVSSRSKKCIGKPTESR